MHASFHFSNVNCEAIRAQIFCFVCAACALSGVREFTSLVQKSVLRHCQENMARQCIILFLSLNFSLLSLLSFTVSVNTHTSDPSPIVTSPSDTASTAGANAALTSTATGSTTINAAAAHERVQAPVEETEGAAAKAEASSLSSEDSCPSPATSGDSPDGSEKGKKKKNRCTNCRKKVGLTGGCSGISRTRDCRCSLTQDCKYVFIWWEF